MLLWGLGFELLLRIDRWLRLNIIFMIKMVISIHPLIFVVVNVWGRNTIVFIVNVWFRIWIVLWRKPKCNHHTIIVVVLNAKLEHIYEVPPRFQV